MKEYILLTFFVVSLFSSCKDENPSLENKNSTNVDTVLTTKNDTSYLPAGVKYIFDINKIPEVYISISTAEWNNFLLYFDKNPHNEELIHADLVFVKDQKKDTLNNVGFRLRGNTSRRRPEGNYGEWHNSVNPDWHHAHFSVNLNKFVKGQKLQGIEKLTLKWFKDDSNYAREVYCYDLFERFGVWIAPQSSYCRLFLKIKEDNKWVNFGVYELVEPVDKEFIKNRISKFADASGNLWKANWGANFVNTDKSRMGIENITLTSTYRPVYDLKTNEANLETAKSQLVEFMTNFNSKQGDDFKTWLNNTMDVSLFLKTYAVNVMCGMWDDYWNNTNNFYFYFDSNNKFYFIPFDYDNTLGTSYLMSNSGTQDLLNWGQNSNPLVSKIVSITEYKSLYVNYLNELCNSKYDLFYYTKSIERITKWQNMIRNYVSNDTNEDMYILDAPANWGNCAQYRLISTTNNYFIIRSQNLPK